MKRTLIIGSSGQDGRLLFEELSTSCCVVGVDVGTIRSHRIDPAQLPTIVDIHDAKSIDDLLKSFAPHELYYLAARHHSSEDHPEDGIELRESMRVNVLAMVNVLEGVRRHAHSCRVFYAGSSHMFGAPKTSPQNEQTPFSPRNPYSISKVAGAHICTLYRERYTLHVSVGILYNHESALRGERFVSQRIVRGAVRAAQDPAFRLRVGSLSAVVDWGYAPDYVHAMTRIIAQEQPDDYVVATGEAHTVRDFAIAAFGAMDLDWTAHVEEDQGIVGSPHNMLIGDASKLRARTGWSPTVTFEQMVRLLVTAARQ